MRSQELFLQKIPELDVGRKKFEATPLANAFDIECNNADTDMVISEGHPQTRGAKKKHANCSESGGEDILNMHTELQSSSKKSYQDSFCSLEQNKERNLRARTISTSGVELLCLEEFGKNDQTEDTLLLSVISG